MTPAIGQISLTKADFSECRVIVTPDKERRRNNGQTLDSPEKLFTKGFAGCHRSQHE